MNRPRSLNKKEILILIFFLSGLACIFFKPISSCDIWLHLKMGEYIVQHDYVLPRADPFSYTAQVKSLILHEWLSQVIFYIVHNALGFTGIRLLRVAMELTALVFIFWAGLRLSGRFLVALLVLLVTAYLFRTRYFIRPELFSLLFFTFFYVWFVTRRRKSRYYHYILFFALCVLWANLHPFIIFACGIIAVLTFTQVAKNIPGISERFTPGAFHYDPILLVLLCLVGSLVNPYGYRIYEYVFGATPVVKQYVQEWQPIFVSLQDGAFRSITGGVLAFPVIMKGLVIGIIVLFLVVLVSSYARKIRWALEDVLIGVFMSYLAITAARFAWLLFVPTLLIVKYGRLHVKNGGLPQRLRPVMITLLRGAAAISCLYWLGQGYDSIPYNFKHEVELDNYPDVSVQILKDTNLSGRLYNPSCWGGYLIYHLYPDYEVFVDTRTHLHGESSVVASMMIQYQYPGFEELIEENDFDLLLFKNVYNHKRPFSLEDWTLIFENANSAIYLRNNERNMMNLNRIAEYYRQHSTPFDPNKGFDLEELRKSEHLSGLYRLS